MGLIKKRMTVTKSLAMNGKDTGAIVGIKGYLLGQIIRMDPDKEMKLGSDASQSDIVIINPLVAKQHCSVKYIQGEKQYQVKNLSDREVIADMEMDLIKDREYLLQPGTRLYVGSAENEIRLG